MNKIFLNTTFQVFITLVISFAIVLIIFILVYQISNVQIKENEITDDKAALTEEEGTVWMDVYQAAVNLGIKYPAREANQAINKLRKLRAGND